MRAVNPNRLACQPYSFPFCVENELQQRTELVVANTLVRPFEHGLDVFGGRVIVETMYDHEISRGNHNEKLSAGTACRVRSRRYLRAGKVSAAVFDPP